MDEKKNRNGLTPPPLKLICIKSGVGSFRLHRHVATAIYIHDRYAALYDVQMKKHYKYPLYTIENISEELYKDKKK